MRSPCVGLCSTTYGDEFCRGCKRYYQDIIDWNSLSESNQQQITIHLEADITAIAQKYIQVTDSKILLAQCQRHEIKHHLESSPLCWAFRLLQKGSDRIQDLSKYGIDIFPEYSNLTLPKLFELMDEQLYDVAITAQ